MKVTIPSSWNELTDYQQREIINIINNTEGEDFTDSFIQIVLVLLMKKGTAVEYYKARKVLNNYPISAFKDLAAFVMEKPELYRFPEIKGLTKPADRIGDLTIKQFSLCDTLLYRYSQEKKEIYLRQLVASLYRMGDFDEQKLPAIAKITDKLDIKEAKRIGFVFSAVRMYITDVYPDIFVKEKEESDPLKPVFRTKKGHTPFSKIIVMMAADELKLLGNLHECQNTKVYDFLNALAESKKIHKMKADATK